MPVAFYRGAPPWQHVDFSKNQEVFFSRESKRMQAQTRHKILLFFIISLLRLPIRALLSPQKGKEERYRYAAAVAALSYKALAA